MQLINMNTDIVRPQERALEQEANICVGSQWLEQNKNKIMYLDLRKK